VLDASLEKVADQTLGLCTVCHDYVDPELLEMDYTACVCLDHFSEQEKRQLESELELSQVVQRGFLPQVIPDIPAWSWPPLAGRRRSWVGTISTFCASAMAPSGLKKYPRAQLWIRLPGGPPVEVGQTSRKPRGGRQSCGHSTCFHPESFRKIPSVVPGLYEDD
jgi:hypothetical protein